MNRIEWEDVTPGNGAVGFVQIAKARTRIASISWSFNRADEKPWVLRTEIPGWKNARHHSTKEEAQASAERILTSFVTAMRPDPSDPEIRQAAENAHDAVGGDAPFGWFMHGFTAGAKWWAIGR